jgi:hypothetical protein
MKTKDCDKGYSLPAKPVKRQPEPSGTYKDRRTVESKGYRKSK